MMIMKNVLPLLLLLSATIGCAQTHDASSESEEESVHWDPTHNFTVMRLIILNDRGEMLLGSEQDVWAQPSLVFESRQFLKENLDSLAAEYGIKIDSPKLHGYFSFKYEYHPYATMRSYFVANHVSGDIKNPERYDELEWMPIAEAIDKITVPAIKQITKQIIDYPNTLWGGSLMVSRDGKAHPTVPTEPFYPLFGSKD